MSHSSASAAAATSASAAASSPASATVASGGLSPPSLLSYREMEVMENVIYRVPDGSPVMTIQEETAKIAIQDDPGISLLPYFLPLLFPHLPLHNVILRSRTGQSTMNSAAVQILSVSTNISGGGALSPASPSPGSSPIGSSSSRYSQPLHWHLLPLIHIYLLLVPPSVSDYTKLIKPAIQRFFNYFSPPHTASQSSSSSPLSSPVHTTPPSLYSICPTESFIVVLTHSEDKKDWKSEKKIFDKMKNDWKDNLISLPMNDEFFATLPTTYTFTSSFSTSSLFSFPSSSTPVNLSSSSSNSTSTTNSSLINTLLPLIKSRLTLAHTSKSSAYENELKRLSLQQSTIGWPFPSYLSVKLSYVTMSTNMGLWRDGVRMIEEIMIMMEETKTRTLLISTLPSITVSTPPMLSPLFDIYSRPFPHLLHTSNVAILEMSRYLYARLAILLLLYGTKCELEVLERGEKWIIAVLHYISATYPYSITSPAITTSNSHTNNNNTSPSTMSDTHIRSYIYSWLIGCILDLTTLMERSISQTLNTSSPRSTPTPATPTSLPSTPLSPSSEVNLRVIGIYKSGLLFSLLTQMYPYYSVCVSLEDKWESTERQRMERQRRKEEILVLEMKKSFEKSFSTTWGIGIDKEIDVFQETRKSIAFPVYFNYNQISIYSKRQQFLYFALTTPVLLPSLLLSLYTLTLQTLSRLPSYSHIHTTFSLLLANLYSATTNHTISAITYSTASLRLYEQRWCGIARESILRSISQWLYEKKWEEVGKGLIIYLSMKRDEGGTNASAKIVFINSKREEWDNKNESVIQIISNSNYAYPCCQDSNSNAIPPVLTLEYCYHFLLHIILIHLNNYSPTQMKVLSPPSNMAASSDSTSITPTSSTSSYKFYRTYSLVPFQSLFSPSFQSTSPNLDTNTPSIDLIGIQFETDITSMLIIHSVTSNIYTSSPLHLVIEFDMTSLWPSDIVWNHFTLGIRIGSKSKEIVGTEEIELEYQNIKVKEGRHTIFLHAVLECEMDKDIIVVTSSDCKTKPQDNNNNINPCNVTYHSLSLETIQLLSTPPLQSSGHRLITLISLWFHWSRIHLHTYSGGLREINRLMKVNVMSVKEREREWLIRCRTNKNNSSGTSDSHAVPFDPHLALSLPTATPLSPLSPRSLATHTPITLIIVNPNHPLLIGINTVVILSLIIHCHIDCKGVTLHINCNKGSEDNNINNISTNKNINNINRSILAIRIKDSVHTRVKLSYHSRGILSIGDMSKDEKLILAIPITPPSHAEYIEIERRKEIELKRPVRLSIPIISPSNNEEVSNRHQHEDNRKKNGISVIVDLTVYSSNPNSTSRVTQILSFLPPIHLQSTLTTLGQRLFVSLTLQSNHSLSLTHCELNVPTSYKIVKEGRVGMIEGFKWSSSVKSLSLAYEIEKDEDIDTLMEEKEEKKSSSLADSNKQSDKTQAIFSMNALLTTLSSIESSSLPLTCNWPLNLSSLTSQKDLHLVLSYPSPVLQGESVPLTITLFYSPTDSTGTSIGSTHNISTSPNGNILSVSHEKNCTSNTNSNNHSSLQRTGDGIDLLLTLTPSSYWSMCGRISHRFHLNDLGQYAYTIILIPLVAGQVRIPKLSLWSREKKYVKKQIKVRKDEQKEGANEEKTEEEQREVSTEVNKEDEVEVEEEEDEEEFVIDEYGLTSPIDQFDSPVLNNWVEIGDDRLSRHFSPIQCIDVYPSGWAESSFAPLPKTNQLQKQNQEHSNIS